MSGLVPVSCRDCGKLALEHATDPAPGLCPECLDRRLKEVTVWLLQQVGSTAPKTVILARFFDRLVDIGLRPAAAARDIRVLAAADGVPCPKNALAASDRKWEREAARYARDGEGR